MRADTNLQWTSDVNNNIRRQGLNLFQPLTIIADRESDSITWRMHYHHRFKITFLEKSILICFTLLLKNTNVYHVQLGPLLKQFRSETLGIKIRTEKIASFVKLIHRKSINVNLHSSFHYIRK